MVNKRQISLVREVIGNVETNEQKLTLAVFTKRKVLLGSKKGGHGRDRVGRVREGASVQTACEQGYKETVGGM